MVDKVVGSLPLNCLNETVYRCVSPLLGCLPIGCRDEEPVAARSQGEVRGNGRETAAYVAQQNREDKQESPAERKQSCVEAVRTRRCRSRPEWILAAGPRRRPLPTLAAIPVAQESWVT